MELASACISHYKKSFINVFGSVEVENVTVTPATRKYWDKLHQPITFFLYILRDFHKFHNILE